MMTASKSTFRFLLFKVQKSLRSAGKLIRALANLLAILSEGFIALITLLACHQQLVLVVANCDYLNKLQTKRQREQKQTKYINLLKTQKYPYFLGRGIAIHNSGKRE